MKNKTSKKINNMRIIDIHDQDYWMDRQPYHEHVIFKGHYLACARIEENLILELCEKISRLEDVINQLKIKARSTQDNAFILGNIIIVRDRINELSLEAKKHDRKLHYYIDKLKTLLDNKPKPPVFEINRN